MKHSKVPEVGNLGAQTLLMPPESAVASAIVVNHSAQKCEIWDLAIADLAAQSPSLYLQRSTLPELPHPRPSG